MPPTPPVLNLTSTVNLGTPPSAVSGLVLATDSLHTGSETATGFSTDRDYSSYRSGCLVINLTAISVTNVVFVVDARDDNPISGAGVYFTQAVSAAITAPATIVWFFDEQSAALPVQNVPSGQTPGTITVIQAHPLVNGTFRLRWAVTGAGSITFSANFYGKPI